MRYERKFSIDDHSPQQVTAIIKTHPAGFRESYPARYVNSLYFDTLDMACLRDTMDGNLHRKKYRIRWYGELAATGHLVLEIKEKEGMLGRKAQYPLPEISLADMRQSRAIKALWQATELPLSLKSTLKGLQPVVIVRYLRHYYVSRDGAFRLTLDEELQAVDIRRQVMPTTRFAPLILELKYPTKLDDEARQLTAAIPFRSTKSSKYVLAVEG